MSTAFETWRVWVSKRLGPGWLGFHSAWDLANLGFKAFETWRVCVSKRLRPRRFGFQSVQDRPGRFGFQRLKPSGAGCSRPWPSFPQYPQVPGIPGLGPVLACSTGRAGCLWGVSGVSIGSWTPRLGVSKTIASRPHCRTFSILRSLCHQTPR